MEISEEEKIAIRFDQISSSSSSGDNICDKSIR